MEATLRFIQKQRDCFCAWRSSRSAPVGSFCLLALVTDRERTIYVVANSVQFAPIDEIYLGAMFAAKQGLIDGELVHVMYEGPVDSIAAAARISVAPESDTDWEVLEANQEKLCLSFLSQCCCVWPNMCLPLWVDNLCLLLRVTAVSDSRSEFAILREHSDVAVEPPGRVRAAGKASPSAAPLSSPSIEKATVVKKNDRRTFLSLFVSLADFIHFLWRGHTYSCLRQMDSLAKRWSEQFALTPKARPFPGRLNFGTSVPTNWPVVLTATSYCGFATARVLTSLCSSTANKKQKEEMMAAGDNYREVVVALLPSEECEPGVLITNSLVLEAIEARVSDCVVVTPQPYCASLLKSVRLDLPAGISTSALAWRKQFLSWLRNNFSDDNPLVLSSGSKLLLDGEDGQSVPCSVTISCQRSLRKTEPEPKFVLLSPRMMSSGFTQLHMAVPSGPGRPPPTVLRPLAIADNTRASPMTSALPPVMLESSLLAALRRSFQDRSFSGAVLCGPPGSGRSTLAAQVGAALSAEPGLQVHCAWLGCREWRAKAFDRFRRETSARAQEVAWRRPGLLVLDDVDVLLAPEGEHEDDTTSFVLANFMRTLFDEVLMPRDAAGEQQQVCVLVTLENPECLAMLTETSLIGSSMPLFNIWLDMPPMSEANLRRVLLPYCVPDPDLFDVTAFVSGLGKALGAFSLDEVKFLLEKEAVEPLSERGAAEDAPARGFESIGGLEEAKELLTRCVLWVRRFPEVFELCPLRPQRGILLFGPTGCGKTRLGRALAAAAKLELITVRGPELLSKFIGGSEANVRGVFARARRSAPCLLFFDEFDALAPRRGHDSTGVTDRVVNQFLTELDGAESQLEGVFIVAASNRPDLIDPAILRPGRLDQHIYCRLPDEKERVEILDICCGELSVDFDCQETKLLLVNRCQGFTGADLRSLLLAARLTSLQRRGFWNVRQVWQDENGDSTDNQFASKGIELQAEINLCVELTEEDVRTALKKVPGSFGFGKEQERAVMEATFAAFYRAHGSTMDPEDARVTLA